MKNEFYNTTTRLLLDFHIPEWDSEILSKFDAKKMVDTWLKSYVDCVTFYAKDHYGHCYYNSKFGHKHKNIGERDLLFEITSEAEKRGLLIQGYYVINWTLNVEDKSFLAVDVNGKTVKHLNEGIRRWPQICYNSENYLKLCIDQVKEIVSNYKICSIWIDMFNYPFDTITCYCDNCKKAFKEQYGYDHLPEKPTWDKIWRDFLAFRFNANYKFANKIREEIKKINPQLAIVYNYHGTQNYNWLTGQKPVMHSSYSDYSSHEIYPNLFGTMYANIVPKYLRGTQPEKPIELLTYRFDNVWDYTIKPKAQYIWEAMTAVANGASIVSVDQPLHTGELDENAYIRIGEVYSYVKSRKNTFKGEDIKFIAVYFSQKTRDFYAREKMENYTLAFNGACKMLIEEHFPLDILFDENIDSINFNNYKIVILANVAILSEDEIEKLKTFVKNGGILISSDETSLYDENGNILINYRLAELYGVNYQGKTEFKYNYFVAPEEYSSDILNGYSILIDGPGNLVTPRNEAKISGSLEIPFYEASSAMFFSHNLHPRWKSVGPAVISKEYFKGKVIYLPFKIFRSYANRYMLPEHRKFIKNIINSLGFERYIKVEAPLNVEIIIKEDSENYYIHMIGYNPTKQISTFTSDPADSNIMTPLMMEEAQIFFAEIITVKPLNNFEIEGNSKVIDQKQNSIKILVKDVYESIKIKK